MYIDIMKDLIIVEQQPIIKERIIDYNLFFNILETMLDNFYTSLDLKPKTIKDYKDSINYFIAWLEKNKGKPICKPTILDYKNYMKLNLKPKTVNLYLSGLRQFFNFLEELGYPNIMRNIKNVKVGQEFSKSPLSIEQFLLIDKNMQSEISELRKLYKDNKIKREKYLTLLRNYAIFNIAVRNLLREIEMYRADKTDIQVKQNKTILKIQSKGSDSKSDFTILTDVTLKILNEYLKIRRNDSFPALFISVSSNCYGTRLSTRSISKILKSIFKEYGEIDTPLITGHSTRHTGATFLHLAKVDMKDIQEVARHKDISTTAIYTHTIDRLVNPTEFRLEDFINQERMKVGQ